MRERMIFEVAPMSKTVKVISWAAPLLVIWCTGAALFALVSFGFFLALFTAALTFAILPLAALFAVRGYALEGNALLVKRLFWTDRIDLSRSARAYRSSFAKTIRVAGNGGLFAISGRYWNKELGKFKAYMTNPDFMVVVEDGERKMALSPVEPERFLAHFSNSRNPEEKAA